MEDYPSAIRLHREVLTHDPKNALAHYHLGFAYGMMGRRQEELAEYRQAVSLGSTDWTLLLNLGLVYLEQDDPGSAADVLSLATLVAPRHPEAHYNLALAYDRLGMLNEAEQEALTALILDPHQPDARNTLAVLYAERGDYARARDEWSDLLLEDPAYGPAKANLAILDHMGAANPGPAKPEVAEEQTHFASVRFHNRARPK
jgi:Flp pilus assembly protein TadD